MNIAIVELSISHEECIYTQVSFLKKKGYRVTLIVHPKLEPQILYKQDLVAAETVNFQKSKGLNSLKEQIKLVRLLVLRIKLSLTQRRPQKKLRNIVFLLNFYKVECIGLLHNTKKLEKSFTQKIIGTKIKKYFVLSEYLKNRVVLKRQNTKIESYYPIFFQKLKKIIYIKRTFGFVYLEE